MAGQISPLAGKKPDPAMLVDVARLVTAYFTGKPDPSVPSQRVAFGTSGHRGSAFDNAFNEDHILAISQAICQHRAQNGVDGPLYIGIDTHALSQPALASALEVFAANDVEAMIDAGDGYTPTPVVSHAILTYNKGRKSGLAEGRDRHHAITQPARGRRLQIQPPERRAGGYRRHQMDRERRQCADREEARGGAAHTL
jgi:phosphoglucomutase